MLYLIAIIVIVLNFIEVKMSDRHQRGRIRVPVVDLLEETVVERQLFDFQFLQDYPDPEKVRLC